MAERLLYTQDVAGSTPVPRTSPRHTTPAGGASYTVACPMADKEPPSATQRFQGLPGDVPSFAVEVIDGVNRGLSARAVNNKLTVGRAEGADLRLTDNSVSKWHFELTAIPDGISVRDLGSANQTIVRGVAVQRAIVSETLEIIAGRTRLRLDVGDGREAVERSERDSFGALVGASAEMREVYRILELVAPTNIPIAYVTRAALLALNGGTYVFTNTPPTK